MDEHGLTYPFGTSTSNSAVAINDFGMVLGVERPPTEDRRYAIFSDQNGTVVRLRGYVGANLNNEGDVLLQELDAEGFLVSRAKIRRLDGTLQELPALNNAFSRFVVTDINDRGDIVGFAGGLEPSNFTGPDAFLLRAGTTTPIMLGHFTDRSSAWINNAGQVVIQDFVLESLPGGGFNPVRHAYFWTQGRLIDLSPGSRTSMVADFNDRGEIIVGWMDRDSPILYRDGQRLSLQPFGLRSSVASISDSGSIYFINSDDCFITTPCEGRFVRADAPLGVSDLQVAVAGLQVSLTWRAPLTGPPVTSYVVEGGSAYGTANLATVDTGSSATSLTAVVQPGVYYVRVRARSGSITGRASNEVIATVTAPPVCTTAPEAPRGLRATVDGTRVTLNWLQAAGATSYVLAARWPANFIQFDTGNTATSYQTFAEARTYFVFLRARNACGTSGASDELEVNVGCLRLTAPTLTPHVNGSAVTLSWTAVPGARQYIIEGGYRPSMINPDFRLPVYSGTSFSGNPQNGTYYVRVLAQNACETGPASNEVTVVVPSP